MIRFVVVKFMRLVGKEWLMTRPGTVLVVDDEATGIIETHLQRRGLDVTVAADVPEALSARPSEYGCVVCGQIGGHTAAELVTRLGRQSLPVVFVYEDDESATTALDAGAAATIPRREPDTDWGTHLAATVDATLRRKSAEKDDAPLLVSAIDELPDIFFVVSVSGDFLRWNDKFLEASDYDDHEIPEMSPTDFFEGEDVERIENAIGRVVVNGRATQVADLVTKDGESIPYEYTGALIDAGGTQAIVGTGRDIRDRRARERELEDQADRLASLNHVNEVIRKVTGALIETETREEIEQTVCEQITESDSYRLAWVGAYDVDSGVVEPRAWAGSGEGYLDARPTGDAADGSVTALTAVREQEVIFAQEIASDPSASAWRRAALDHGHEAAAAIPIGCRGSTFGCLCLYAERPNAFGALEREVLAELGETIGHAIQAAETRRALASDTVTELELQITDERSFLVQAAKETEAELELVGSTGNADGSLVLLLAVRGISGEAVREYAAVAPMPASVVTERADEFLVRATVTPPSIPHELAELGGSLRTITAEDGQAQLGVDLPRDVEVSAALARIYSILDVQLLSQQTVDRNRRTAVDFRADIERELTDRQLEVLETAYEVGFFDWPREQNGADVAAVLDVSPPTFHQHLRIGERKLMEILFDQRPTVATDPQTDGQPDSSTEADPPAEANTESDS